MLKDESQLQLSGFTFSTIRKKCCNVSRPVPLLPLYCVLTWNSAERRGLTFLSCLFHFETQTSPVWIKAINNLPHVLHCSLITATPFLCCLHCSRGFYHPSLLILSRSLVVEGEIWRILFSDHTKLSSHMPTFFLPVLLLNKELQVEWGKRERAKGRVIEWNKRTWRRFSLSLSCSLFLLNVVKSYISDKGVCCIYVGSLVQRTLHFVVRKKKSGNTATQAQTHLHSPESYYTK